MNEQVPIQADILKSEVVKDIAGIKPSDFEKIYQERRSKIMTSDDKLIEFALEKGTNFRDQTVGVVTTTLGSKLYKEKERGKYVFDPDEDFVDISKKLHSYPLIDIGCSELGAFSARKMMEFMGIKKAVLVDPFLENDSMVESLEYEAVRREQSGDSDIASKLRASEFIKKDGLGYCVDQNSPRGNFLISSINYSLISNTEYHQRLAQEVFRLLPDDGMLIINNSQDIEREARKLFPFCREIGSGVYIFEKTRKSELDN